MKQVIIIVAVIASLTAFTYMNRVVYEPQKNEVRETVPQKLNEPPPKDRVRFAEVVGIQKSSDACYGGPATTLKYWPENKYVVICDWYSGKVGDMIEEDTE